ncbi:uncharacterized protein LOC144116243 [Amblyomma americanum]
MPTRQRPSGAAVRRRRRQQQQQLQQRRRRWQQQQQQQQQQQFHYEAQHQHQAPPSRFEQVPQGDQEMVDGAYEDFLLQWPGVAPSEFHLPPSCSRLFSPHLGGLYAPYTDLGDLFYPNRPFHTDELQDETNLNDFDAEDPQQQNYARWIHFLTLHGFTDRGEEHATGTPHTAGTENAQSRTSLNEARRRAQAQAAAVERYLLEVYYGPVVTKSGVVSVFLKHRIRVDISIDNAVRVVNFTKHSMAAINRLGDRTCVCHPCGRVLQEGVSMDLMTGMRLARISGRGITFSALDHGLVYVVDESGTKSTTEWFKVLCYDLPSDVFSTDSEQGSNCVSTCFQIVSQARFKSTRNGDDVWLVAGARIKQTPWGDVQVSRDSGSRFIWTSPSAGTVSVTTPTFRALMTCNPSKFVFLKMGQKRMMATAEGFTVRNGSQKAGFDSQGRLTLQ